MSEAVLVLSVSLFSVSFFFCGLRVVFSSLVVLLVSDSAVRNTLELRFGTFMNPVPKHDWFWTAWLIFFLLIGCYFLLALRGSVGS